jgi:hypothetical protein
MRPKTLVLKEARTSSGLEKVNISDRASGIRQNLNAPALLNCTCCIITSAIDENIYLSIEAVGSTCGLLEKYGIGCDIECDDFRAGFLELL